MHKHIKEFIERYEDIINNNEWEQVYWAALMEVSPAYIGKFTDCLLEVGVDPAKLLDSIPKYYLYNSNITSYSIPHNVKTIGQYAFSLCENLKNIVIPENVKSIDYGAFRSSLLENITFSEGLTTINARAFTGCLLKNLYLPESLKELYVGAFENNRNLESVSIGQNIETFGADVFKNCDKLTEITYRGPIEKFKSISGQRIWNFQNTVKRVICSDGVFNPE